jgi:[acyl-carrier-protein] S-malonyltransferase
MGKIGIIFPGQGAHFVGMGKALCEMSESARAVFEKIDVLRPGTSALCFGGPEEELNKTINTQPCIFAVEQAALAFLRDNGIVSQGYAGFSLGEITGLVASGILSLEEGLDFVTRRGRAMESASQICAATMIAVLKLDNETVESLCQEFNQCYPVNYNCPGQLVVALLREDVDLFLKRVKEIGGRGMSLDLSGGFHSPFMTYATELLQQDLNQFKFQSGSVPLYANASAQPYPASSEEIKSYVLHQIDHPVQWEKIIRNMIMDGYTTFIECGPGKTLGGFIKKIDASVLYYHYETLLAEYSEAKNAGKEWSFIC